MRCEDDLPLWTFKVGFLEEEEEEYGDECVESAVLY